MARQGPLTELLLIHAWFHLLPAQSLRSGAHGASTQAAQGNLLLHQEPRCCVTCSCPQPVLEACSLAQGVEMRIAEPHVACSCSPGTLLLLTVCQKWLQMTCVNCKQFVGLRKHP